MIKKLILSLASLSLLAVPAFVQANNGNTPKNEVSKTISNTDKQKVEDMFSKFITSVGKKREKYQLVFDNAEIVNAHVTLGRKLTIYRGLIDYLNGNEAALAFVVAHELGHIEENHVVHSMMRHSLFQLIGYQFFRASRIYSAASQFKVLHFSRGSEKEADLFAKDLMIKYYCSAPGKLELFEKLSNGKTPSKLSEFMSTHPHPQTRLDYLKNEFRAAGCAV